MIKKFKEKFINNLKEKWYRDNLIVLGIGFILISSLSVGYAVLSQTLNIKGEITLRADKDIRITKVESDNKGCGFDTYNAKYNENSITVNGELPGLECELKYLVTIVNKGSKAMQLIDINDETYSNKNIVYELDGIQINTIFFPDTTTIFTVIFSYDSNLQSLPDNIKIGAVLEFIWEIAILDTEPPVVTLLDKDNYTIFSGTDMDLKSLVKVTDNIDVDIETKLVINSSPSNFSNTNGGLYTITYSATDSSNNKSNIITINIYVIEFIKIAGGRFHTLALTVDGYVYAWGHNDLRQIGDGTVTNRLNPIKIASLKNIVDISAGYGSSYAVNEEGIVYSWGYGIYGQLGHNNANNINNPTIIAGLNGKKIIQISAAYHTVAALSSEGRVYTWGYNAYRQVGDGTVNLRYAPYEIPSLTGIKQISAGYWHTLAATDNEIYVWGSNAEGQLGISALTITGTPTELILSSDIKKISAGGRHSIVLTTDDKVYGFGYNVYGQVGDGSTTTYIREPTLLSTLSNIKEISAGYEHSTAVTNDGNVYVWGYNTYAKLGLGNTTTQRSPVLNNHIEKSRFAPASFENTYFINSVGGVMYGTGYNVYGQLGNGTIVNSSAATWGSVPSKVIFINY